MIIGPIAWIHPSRSGHSGNPDIMGLHSSISARMQESRARWSLRNPGELSAISTTENLHEQSIDEPSNHPTIAPPRSPCSRKWWFVEPLLYTWARGYCWPRKKKKENVRNIGKYGAVDDWPTNAGFSMSTSRSLIQGTSLLTRYESPSASSVLASSCKAHAVHPGRTGPKNPIGACFAIGFTTWYVDMYRQYRHNAYTYIILYIYIYIYKRLYPYIYITIYNSNYTIYIYSHMYIYIFICDILITVVNIHPTQPNRTSRIHFVSSDMDRNTTRKRSKSSEFTWAAPEKSPTKIQKI